MKYRVMYQRAGDEPRVWAKAISQAGAEILMWRAREENRWGELWIERKPIVEWERLP